MGRFEGMNLPESRARVPRLVWREETGSTNDDVCERIARGDVANWPNFATIATLDQRAGRGRLGRSWGAPRGTSLAVSVLVRPSVRGDQLPNDRVGWLSLGAGLAMTETVRAALSRAGADPSRAELKWPNDVVVKVSSELVARERKISGILCEVVADRDGAPVVVIGAGLNVAFDAETAPTPTSTSLAIEHAVPSGSPLDETIDSLLADYLTRLTAHVSRYLETNGDVRTSGIRDAVTAVCGTLGRRVSVERSGEDTMIGIAVGFDSAGRLLVQTTTRGTQAVAAGDITHLRY